MGSIFFFYGSMVSLEDDQEEEDRQE